MKFYIFTLHSMNHNIYEKFNRTGGFFYFVSLDAN